MQRLGDEEEGPVLVDKTEHVIDETTAELPDENDDDDVLLQLAPERQRSGGSRHSSKHSLSLSGAGRGGSKSKSADVRGDHEATSTTGTAGGGIFRAGSPAKAGAPQRATESLDEDGREAEDVVRGAAAAGAPDVEQAKDEEGDDDTESESDLDNVFEIRDFTAVSPLEKLSRELELITKGWSSHFRTAAEVIAAANACREKAQLCKYLQVVAMGADENSEPLALTKQLLSDAREVHLKLLTSFFRKTLALYSQHRTSQGRMIARFRFKGVNFHLHVYYGRPPPLAVSDALLGYYSSPNLPSPGLNKVNGAPPCSSASFDDQLADALAFDGKFPVKCHPNHRRFGVRQFLMVTRERDSYDINDDLANFLLSAMLIAVRGAFPAAGTKCGASVVPREYSWDGTSGTFAFPSSPGVRLKNGGARRQGGGGASGAVENAQKQAFLELDKDHAEPNVLAETTKAPSLPSFEHLLQNGLDVPCLVWQNVAEGAGGKTVGEGFHLLPDGRTLRKHYLSSARSARHADPAFRSLPGLLTFWETLRKKIPSDVSRQYGTSWTKAETVIDAPAAVSSLLKRRKVENYDRHANELETAAVRNNLKNLVKPQAGPQIRARFVYLCEEFDAMNYNPVVSKTLELIQLFCLWGPFSKEDYFAGEGGGGDEVEGEESSPPLRSTPDLQPPAGAHQHEEVRARANSDADRELAQHLASNARDEPATSSSPGIDVVVPPPPPPPPPPPVQDHFSQSSAKRIEKKLRALLPPAPLDPANAHTWQFRVTCGDAEKRKSRTRELVEYFLDFESETSDTESVSKFLGYAAAGADGGTEGGTHQTFSISFHLATAYQDLILPNEAEQARILDGCLSAGGTTNSNGKGAGGNMVGSSYEAVVHDQVMELFHQYELQCADSRRIVESERHFGDSERRDILRDWEGHSYSSFHDALCTALQLGVSSSLGADDSNTSSKSTAQDVLQSPPGSKTTSIRRGAPDHGQGAEAEPEEPPPQGAAPGLRSPAAADAVASPTTSKIGTTADLGEVTTEGAEHQQISGQRKEVVPGSAPSRPFVETLRALEALHQTTQSYLKGAPTILSGLLQEIVLEKGILNFRAICTMYLKLVQRLRHHWNSRKLFVRPVAASIAEENQDAMELKTAKKRFLADLGLRRASVTDFRNCLAHQRFEVLWHCIEAELGAFHHGDSKSSPPAGPAPAPASTTALVRLAAAPMITEDVLQMKKRALGRMLRLQQRSAGATVSGRPAGASTSSKMKIPTRGRGATLPRKSENKRKKRHQELSILVSLQQQVPKMDCEQFLLHKPTATADDFVSWYTASTNADGSCEHEIALLKGVFAEVQCERELGVEHVWCAGGVRGAHQGQAVIKDGMISMSRRTTSRPAPEDHAAASTSTPTSTDAGGLSESASTAGPGPGLVDLDVTPTSTSSVASATPTKSGLNDQRNVDVEPRSGAGAPGVVDSTSRIQSGNAARSFPYYIDPALFDPRKEAEHALHYLENVSTNLLWRQLFHTMMQVLLKDFIVKHLKRLLVFEDFFLDKFLKPLDEKLRGLFAEVLLEGGEREGEIGGHARRLSEEADHEVEQSSSDLEDDLEEEAVSADEGEFGTPEHSVAAPADDNDNELVNEGAPNAASGELNDLPRRIQVTNGDGALVDGAAAAAQDQARATDGSLDLGLDSMPNPFDNDATSGAVQMKTPSKDGAAGRSDHQVAAGGEIAAPSGGSPRPGEIGIVSPGAYLKRKRMNQGTSDQTEHQSRDFASVTSTTSRLYQTAASFRKDTMISAASSSSASRTLSTASDPFQQTPKFAYSASVSSDQEKSSPSRRTRTRSANPSVPALRDFEGFFNTVGPAAAGPRLVIPAHLDSFAFHLELASALDTVLGETPAARRITRSILRSPGHRLANKVNAYDERLVLQKCFNRASDREGADLFYLDGLVRGASKDQDVDEKEHGGTSPPVQTAPRPAEDNLHLAEEPFVREYLIEDQFTRIYAEVRDPFVRVAAAYAEGI